MFVQSAVMFGLMASPGPAAPATRVAVLFEDPATGAPTAAAVEAALQTRGYQVVAPETAARIREVVAPEDLLAARLPEGLSVFEADAILAGTATYAEPATVDEGIQNQTVVVTARLIDIGTARAAATTQATGVALGAIGATRVARAAKQAVDALFAKTVFTDALAHVGQTSGSVTLIVQAVPDRDALAALRRGLERSLAGAPVQEVYFAAGLGKLVLGGSKSPDAMSGPDIADLVSEDRSLPLTVVEVANTRIVARYDRSRTVRVHALVLEPKLEPMDKRRATQLGKYVATHLATFDFARASYQRGRLNRRVALRRARRIGADVVVESEVLNIDDSAALLIRVVDVATGRPIMRQQRVIDESTGGGLQAAKDLLSDLQSHLPEKLAERPRPDPKPREDTNPTAASEPSR